MFNQSQSNSMPEKLSNMSFILSPSQSVPIISFTSSSDASIQEFSRQDKRIKTLLPFASVKQHEQHVNINAGVFMKDWKSCPSGGQVTFDFSPPSWKVIRHGQADGRPFLTLVKLNMMKYSKKNLCRRSLNA